jgi:hypothetical protein
VRLEDAIAPSVTVRFEPSQFCVVIAGKVMVWAILESVTVTVLDTWEAVE